MSHDFELIDERDISELDTRGRLYRHRTGAELLSLSNDDENKVFGITFRTPPEDSTGVAHILEHSVLCGSRKYPVKEPFVELLKGSLKTFLNAFTYPDKTCYPVASQNLQDFYNLIDVYLDAVFHPRLTPQVLQQEGWHYELEEAGGPLVFKGVVFNEMKGANSSPDRVMAEYVQHSLFPGNTYGVDSGGHPREIPDLTYEQFEAFHRDFYHPANARIYFYGDDPAERRFELLEEYLGDYEPAEIRSAVAWQPPFPGPQRIERTYAAGEEEGEEGRARSMVTVNWLMHEEIDPVTGLGLQILEHVLLGTPGSPLRKALIESGLGEDLSGTGMETELQQFFFSIGLKGVAREDEEQVVELVLQILESLAGEGIDRETVTAALNTSEFRLRENNTGSYPRGLALMLRALTTWLYDRDPFAPLSYAEPLAEVRRRAEAGGWFEQLIRRRLLDNSHRTTLYLRADEEQARREEREEQERLSRAREGMSDGQLQRIAEEAKELARRQQQPDDPADLARLPRLTLKDLEPEIRTIPLDRGEVAGAPALFHDLFTNGIVYADVGFSVRTLPERLLPYLPLFGRALLEMGTEEEDFVQLAQRIGARTGGVWPHTLISSRRGSNEAAARFFLRGKAMVGQVGDLVDIIGDILNTVNLDNRERFLQMALEERAEQEAGLVPGGHGVVALRLKAQLDEAAWVSEQMEGVSYLFFLRQLVADIESDWPGVLARLEELRGLLVNRRTLLCNATLTDADRPGFERQLAGLVETLPDAPAQEGAWEPRYERRCEGLVIPAQVNYVGKAADLYELGYELHGSVAVITRHLRNTWLWDRVRVQGGAYGAFCSFDPFSGILAFASYRDPNLSGTLANFDNSARFLREEDLPEEELTKAIIGTIGDLDAYQLPDARGYTSMVRELTGLDDGFRQRMRDAVLATTAAEFRAFADVLDEVGRSGRVAVLGSRDALEAANAGGQALELVPVL